MRVLETRMRHALLFICIAAIYLAQNKRLAFGQDQVRQPAARQDAYGDPLPPGAVARLGTLRLRHQHPVQCAALSPDGRLIASLAENEKFIRIWDSDGKVLGQVKVDAEEPIQELFFGPGGKILVGVCYGKQGKNLYLWNPLTGRQLHRLQGHVNTPLSVAFIEGGKTLISVGEDAKVKWWDTTTGELKREWSPNAKDANEKSRWELFFQAALAGEGRFLVATAGKASEEKHVALVVWDLADNKVLWQLTKDAADPYCFDASADQKVVAVIAGGESISVRDLVTGRQLRSIAVPFLKDCIQESIALSPDGKTLAMRTRRPVGACFWDLESGKALPRLVTGMNIHLDVPARRFSFPTDGKVLLCALGNSLRLWNASKGIDQLPFAGHREAIGRVYFGLDGKTLFSGTENGGWYVPEHAILWSTKTWREFGRLEFHPDEYSSATEKHGAALSVSPDYTKELRFKEKVGYFVCDRANGNKLCRLNEAVPGEYTTWNGWFSPSGETVALWLSDIKLFNVRDGRKKASLPADARSLTFAAQDASVAWFDPQGVIRGTDLKTGKEAFRLGPPVKDWLPESAPHLAYSSDGRRLASWPGLGKDVTIWDLPTRKPFRLLPVPQPPDGFYQSITFAFSQDGRWLAIAGGARNDFELWDLASGKLAARIKGHVAPVKAVACSPQGRFLASASDDSTVLIWDLDAVTAKK